MRWPGKAQRSDLINQRKHQVLHRRTRSNYAIPQGYDIVGAQQPVIAEAIHDQTDGLKTDSNFLWSLPYQVQ